jgi:hypothetical protein
MESSNFVSIPKLGFWWHVWDKLGFGQSYPDASDLEEDPRFAPGALLTVTKTQLDWPDRLRVLVSGRIVVRARTVTDVPVKVAITRSTFSICRPGEPM